MTRFARAKGSKSSNERIPESATSWQDMKNQLIENNEKNQTQQNSNYKSSEKPCNSTEKQTVNAKWSDFPDMNVNNKKRKPKNKKDSDLQVKKQKNKHNSSEFTATDKEDETCKKAGRKNKNELSSCDTEKVEKDSTNTQVSTSNKRKPKMSKSNMVKGSNPKQPTKEQKRRKPNSEIHTMYINGNEVEISYVDGFPVKKSDAERITKLRKEMISRGLPKSEIAKALKLERRRAEKALAREKKKVCFNCRYSGHTLSECPMLKDGPNAQMSETGICFKCGSTEHTHFECKVTRGDNFKFAQCFICKEQGHIARQCPDNNRGLYPKGGACRECGAVTHLKKDCPKYQAEQEEHKVVAHTIDDQNIEALENETRKINRKVQHSQKIIKF